MKGILHHYDNLSRVLEILITDGNPNELMDSYGEKELDITITDQKQKRSLNANAYAWELIGKLAAKLRLKKEEVYLHIIRDIGDNYEIIRMPDKSVDAFRIAWKENHLGRIIDVLDSDGTTADVIVYYGSSDYDTRQMSIFIDSIVAECRENGIETITPRERDALLREWGKRYA